MRSFWRIHESHTSNANEFSILTAYTEKIQHSCSNAERLDAQKQKGISNYKEWNILSFL